VTSSLDQVSNLKKQLTAKDQLIIEKEKQVLIDIVLLTIQELVGTDRGVDYSLLGINGFALLRL